MGRNAGSQMQITCTSDGASYAYIWYCQQHAKWAVKTHSSAGSAETEIEEHFETHHGLPDI